MNKLDEIKARLANYEAQGSGYASDLFEHTKADLAALVKAVEEVRAVVVKLKAGNGDEYDIGCIVERALAPLLADRSAAKPTDNH